MVTNMTINVDAKDLDHSDSLIKNCEWNWVDETTASQQPVSHTCDTSGHCTIIPTATNWTRAPMSTSWMASVSKSATDVLRWDSYDIELTNNGSYTNAEKYRMDLTSTFTGPSNQSISVLGFWDGGETFRIRFAPPEAGDWTWVTSSSETSLDGQSGSFTAGMPTQSEIDANPNRRGFVHPVVTNDGRFYQYADGTPFLYAAGTLWDGNSKEMRFSSDFQQYIDDRNGKGFTAIQILVGGPANDYGGPRNTGNNEGGLLFAGTKSSPDYSEINPSNLQEFDKRIEYIHESGMVPNLFFEWGGQYDVQTTEQLKDYYQYLVARYGAYNILFTISGEYPHSSYYPKTSKITEAAQHASDVDGQNHSMSIHPDNARTSSSTDFAGDGWINHHTLQTGGADGHDVQNLEDSWNADTVPVINGEPHVANAFDSSRTKVRRDPWQNMISGRAAGLAHLYYPIAYDYHTVDELNNHIDAVETEDVSVAYKFLSDIRWYELIPAQDLVVSGQSNSESSLKVASYLPDGSLQLVYYSDNSSAKIDLSPISTANAAVSWYNTIEGTSVSEGAFSTDTIHTFSPPSEWVDGLLIAEPT